MVLVRTSERAGTCFIRTDQLDGETDWKLRLAVPSTQRLGSDVVQFLSFLPSSLGKTFNLEPAVCF